MIRNPATPAPVEIARCGAACRLTLYGYRCGLVQTSRQPLQLDIAIPTIAAMILQADIALARMILVSHIELVRTSIGPLIRLAPFVQIDLRDWLAIEHDR